MRVLILHTGGTLGMRPREPDRVLEPDEFGTALLQYAPELSELADVETRVFCHLDSSDVGPAHWLGLAETIAAAFDDHDGVVITHGTDTMSYTASALSYLLHGLSRPVIITGSQRPLAEPRTDARANLVGAVDLATRDVPEVAIYFHGLLLRGNRCTKASSFAYGAFASPNHAPLAEVGTSIQWQAPRLAPGERLEVVGDFDPRVAVVPLLPGHGGEYLLAAGDAGARAVLVEAYGVGNIPVRDAAIGDAIADLVQRGVAVAMAAQSPHGTIDLGRYAGGQRARQCGAFGIGDLTLEAAAVKLMYILGTDSAGELTENALLTPIAGEVTPPA